MMAVTFKLEFFIPSGCKWHFVSNLCQCSLHWCVPSLQQPGLPIILVRMIQIIYENCNIIFFSFIFILIFVDMLVILHKKNLLWSSVNAFFILLNLYFFFQYLPILRKSVKKFNFKFLLIFRGISNFISGEDSTILKFLFFTSLQMSASADALNSLFADRWSLLIW